MRPLRLAIVGGGPSATYVLERLAATARRMTEHSALEIHVFDRSGRFGDGQVHSSAQPASSFLNRIVGQVAFAADETVDGAEPLLEERLRPTLHEWCRRKFAETGDPVFDLRPEDWPKRYVHGMALQECFHTYVELLNDHPTTTVRLRHAEVTDIHEVTEGFTIDTDEESAALHADHVLFVTGHSSNEARTQPRTSRLAEFADRTGATYVSSVYPLERHLGPRQVTPETVVGCAGMGLTAIDVVLYLSEGRGGRFERHGDHLVYHPSGSEPNSVVVFGEAGLFTFARPYNAKERDPERLEHRGVFLVESAVDALRESVGEPIDVGSAGVRRQLDFERHLLPIVLLEMGSVYYRTLLGADFARELDRRARPAYENFLRGGDPRSYEGGAEVLLETVNTTVRYAADVIDSVLTGRRTLADAAADATSDGWDLRKALERYLEVVFGREAAYRALERLMSASAPVDVITGLHSPWRHARMLRDNLFVWQSTIRPIDHDSFGNAAEYRDAVLDFMDRDHRFAVQDNTENPSKAAADNVWRDLRPVLAYAVDFGGLRAESHRRFLDTYMRHHNRLCNGAALEVMEKIEALVRYGLVDVSAGPEANLEVNERSGRFEVSGPHTGARIDLDLLVDSRVHPFSPEHDVLPLYSNMLRRGLVRKWRNPGSDGRDFEPGGLDLSADFHPVRADGSIDHRLTFLGPPSEGVMFFQLGALRPNQNHHVMQDVLRWLRDFWEDLAEHHQQQETSNEQHVEQFAR
ncbi:FAD-NAD(P)-binding [Actinopolyspora mzabensis]|uniref:FAD-NAD(P)-binding n=1 Tax=Actinopolyspora mzabensis TaxID=995066 RepID=A0A1G9A157_ACTMZ|nr:FAD/NAD(P)-binding protein [Actinopolyspora mzabensis]SDK20991.1 FAD-NAD(P)-binding [Actinopolyspora mzabensis]